MSSPRQKYVLSLFLQSVKQYSLNPGMINPLWVISRIRDHDLSISKHPVAYIKSYTYNRHYATMTLSAVRTYAKWNKMSKKMFVNYS
jgi:hypothetical protein